jgi:hypothetical protein
VAQALGTRHTANVVAFVFTDLLGFGAVFLVCGGLLWLANHIEPHWVARDGSRFLTTAQELDQWGLPTGRRREVRVKIDEEAEALLISRRSLLRPSQGIWVVDAKPPDPPRNKAVYLLKEMTGSETNRLALRVPSDSKVAPRLDALLAITGADVQRERELSRIRAQRQKAPGPAPATEASDAPESPPADPPADPG